MVQQRRSFSDNDKAAALAALDANGGNVLKTAKQINVPRSTLQEWANGRVNHDVPELRQRKKEDLAGRLVEIAHLLVDAIPDKIEGANLQQVATSLGITVEKIQLLQGQATERNEIIDNGLSDDERAARITAILERARTRRDQSTPD